MSKKIYNSLIYLFNLNPWFSVIIFAVALLGLHNLLNILLKGHYFAIEQVDIWKSFYTPSVSVWISLWVPLSLAVFAFAWGCVWFVIAKKDRTARRLFNILGRQAIKILVWIPVFLLSLLSHSLVLIAVEYFVLIGLNVFFLGRFFYIYLKNIQDIRGRNIGIFIFVISLSLYIPLSGWVSTMVSAHGGTIDYLMTTHSLARDGDMNLLNNFKDQSARSFYWYGEPDPAHETFWGKNGGLYNSTLTGLYTFILLPGYFLMGRLGAVLIQMLFLIGIGLTIFQWCLDLKFSKSVSFWTWMAYALSYPVAGGLIQLYPEVLTGFLVVFLGRLFTKEKFENTREFIVFVFCLCLLPCIKMRYLSLVLGFGLPFLFRRGKLRLKFMLLGASVLTLGSFYLVDRYSFQGALFLVRFQYILNWAQLKSFFVPDQSMLRGFLGFFLDQEFGLLFNAPVLLLGVIGFVFYVAIKRNRVLRIVFPIFFYIYVLLRHHFVEWYGGWASFPLRYFICILPLFAPGLAFVLSRCRSRFSLTVLSLSGVFTVLMCGLLFLFPHWQYNTLDGAARILEVLSWLVDYPLAPFFPSFTQVLKPGQIAYGWISLLVLFILVGMMVFIEKKRSISSMIPWLPFYQVSSVAGIIFIFAVVVLFIPVRRMEAEQMNPSTGYMYADWDSQYPYLKEWWCFNQEGSLNARINLKQENNRLFVLIGCRGDVRNHPVLEVFLDGEKVGEKDLLLEEEKIRKEMLTVDFRAKKGFHGLEFRVRSLKAEEGVPSASVYVDDFRIEPLSQS